MHKRKGENSLVKSGCMFNLKLRVMIMIPMILIMMMTIWYALFFGLSLPLFEIMISNLDIKADIELRGSGFYLCSQDYGTLCFLPSDRDTQIPHGRPLSTAWSSAECHWHRSPSNRSKSSTPATARPLRHQPQPTSMSHVKGKRRQTEMGGDIQITILSQGESQ